MAVSCRDSGGQASASTRPSAVNGCLICAGAPLHTAAMSSSRPSEATETSRLALSHYQLAELWAARASGAASASVSLDLGRTKTEVDVVDEGVTLPWGTHLPWTALEAVRDQDNVCFALTGAGLEPIRAFSEGSQRTFQLMPTLHAPALLIAGFTMHRFRDTSPAEGAALMVRALSPIRGRVLDTATGLGYAAIEAAKYAQEVVTIELDPMAQAMARANPWSEDLFRNPKITQLMGNSADLIATLESGSFSAVLHDPPAVNLAGELYAESFYAEVLRVLGRGGRFFHYIGDPKSASGARTTKGVVRRMQSAGFARVMPRPEAFGVLAVKER